MQNRKRIDSNVCRHGEAINRSKLFSAGHEARVDELRREIGFVKEYRSELAKYKDNLFTRLDVQNTKNSNKR